MVNILLDIFIEQVNIVVVYYPQLSALIAKQIQDMPSRWSNRSATVSHDQSKQWSHSLAEADTDQAGVGTLVSTAKQVLLISVLNPVLIRAVALVGATVCNLAYLARSSCSLKCGVATNASVEKLCWSELKKDWMQWTRN